MQPLDATLVSVGFILVALQVWVARQQVTLGKDQTAIVTRQADVSERLLELEDRRDKAVLKIAWVKGIGDDRLLEVTLHNVGGRDGRLKHIMISWDSIREDANWMPPGTKVPMQIGGIALPPVGFDADENVWRDVEPPPIKAGEAASVVVALSPGAPGNLGKKGFPKWEQPHLMTFRPEPVIGEGQEMEMKVWWPRHETWVREHNQRVAERLAAQKGEEE